MTESTEPIDLDTLYLAACLPEVNWREEFARLYDDAEATEDALHKELATLKAEIERLSNQPSKAERLAESLRELTGDSVSIDMTTWSYKHTYHDDETVTTWNIWSSRMNSSVSAETLTKAEAMFREKWAKWAETIAPPTTTYELDEAEPEPAATE